MEGIYMPSAFFNARRSLKLVLIAVCVIGALSVNGCGIFIAPFESGIRMITDEQTLETPGVTFPISMAAVYGVLIVTLGPPSGSQSQFAGYTGSNGVADFPQANSNAEWQLAAQFEASSAPVCPDWGPETRNGDPAGLIEQINCVVC
jgi:hypothetical protein